jgi:two-component system response regulator NreC
MDSNPIRCLLVDDHALFRAGLRRLLESEPGVEVVAEAADAAEGLEKVLELRPDIVLMDIAMPGLNSFESARRMTQEQPATQLIFLTMHEEEQYLLRGLEVGAAGYLLKDTPVAELIRVLREVQQGHRYVSPQLLVKVDESTRVADPAMSRGTALTPREREVLKMIAEGSSVRQVAGRLGLSPKTVEAHKFNLMRKLDIHNKAQLVTYAIQKKILQVPAETENPAMKN